MAQWVDAYSGRSSYELVLDVTRVSSNIAANTSVLRIQMWARSKSGSGSWAADSFGWAITGPWGTISGSRNLDFRPDSAGKTLSMVDTTRTVAHNSDGSLTISVRGTHTTTSVFGSADTGSQGLTLPTIPRTPTGLAVARVSDTQHTLNWTRNSTYTSVTVQRRTDDGAWQQIAVAAGNAASFSDTTTVANRKYEWRVLGNAAAGQSAASTSVIAYTTPAPPTGASATRQGNDIIVSVSTVPPWATSYDVRDGATVVATGVSLPWTHVAPNPATPHTYQVRAKNGALTGDWSTASNTVQLLSPPNPPTGLAPNGGVRPSDAGVLFTWVHAPVDSSAQTAYELRYRVPAGAWTNVSGTTASSRTIALGVGSREWEVRTKGSHPDFGPWSATAAFAVIDRPGVAVVQPDTEWDASVLPVVWTYLQAQGRPQSAWQVELIDDGDVVVEARSGSGAGTTVTLAHRVTEGDWTVRVRAATGDVWSDWATSMFAVVFDPPALPMIDGAWDETQGGVGLTIAAGDDGAAPATVRLLVERLVDGTWETLADLTSATSLIDWESSSFGDIDYRVSAFTAEGAASSTVLTVEARSRALWLSGGVGFSDTARLPLNPDVAHSGGRQRALKEYAGRSKPVVLTGAGTRRSVAVSGNVWDTGDTATAEHLIELAQSESDLFLFRDPDGRRIFGMVDGADLRRVLSMKSATGWNGYWRYSFTMTEATR